MTYRISGHESFTCRYAWLPKVVRSLDHDNRLMANEEQAMVELGVGRNMVRSIRFWAQAADVIEGSGRDGVSRLTDFANTLLGRNGLDPFLEDIRTLWLIHWKLATNIHHPLLAWDYLLNRWHEPEMVPAKVLKALQKEAATQTGKLSSVTLEQHWETFLHTYVPTRGRKGEIQEDNLDCPLVELALLLKVGDRDPDQTSDKRETIYAFRREEKPEIDSGLFVYCLNEFWQQRHSAEATLPFREVAHGHGSPGQIFKLPEEDVLTRLAVLERDTGGRFSYTESMNSQQIQRHGDTDSIALLRSIY